MKPYLYILAVLTVGVGVGFYLGQRTSIVVQTTRQPAHTSDERGKIEQILHRQQEAYRLHQPLLLFRDCSSFYVEINAKTGESYNLAKAIVHSSDIFNPGKSVTFTLADPEITIVENTAVVKAKYSKLSNQFDEQGQGGLAGQGMWVLCKSNNRWEIAAFVWTEDRKE
jgi:hypothetical protein